MSQELLPNNQNQPKTQDWILGIDLGVNSVGWARLSNTLQPLDLGARVFDAGNDGDIEQGKDESRNAKRQSARSQRRNLQRRAWRLGKVQRMLHAAKLLPTVADPAEPLARDQMWKQLDRDLYAKLIAKSSYSAAQTTTEQTRLSQLLPYLLRANALDQKLEPHELGRAFYHLAQRRGYLSNRKDSKKISRQNSEENSSTSKTKVKEKDAKEAELGKVLEGIKNLSAEFATSGARTLGEFFSRLDPAESRIRTRYTSRKMYADEFEAIWLAQAVHHPLLLTDENKKRIHRAIFKQREMKSARYRVITKNKGKPNERKVYLSIMAKCELERQSGRGRPCAPWAHPVAQRFRMIQKVNDLEGISSETGEIIKFNDPQHKALRQQLIEALEKNGDMSFGAVRKLPLIKQSKIKVFNLEKGGEEEIPGDNITAVFADPQEPIFGERWFLLPEIERNNAVLLLLGIEKEETLEKIGRTRFGLSPEEARRYSTVKLPRKYVSHSRKAIQKLLVEMEGKGNNGCMSYMSARKMLYPGSFETVEPVDTLPPVLEAIPELRNPNVLRALTETRKVVNALIRKYGKPAKIRIELARDLKRGPKEREKIWKKSRDQQKTREEAARDLQSKGVSNPRRSDIEKYQLWEECNRECPYTGKPISFNDLFGNYPKFDIEHIIPFSRCLDDSYLNKTLCCVDFNRNVKKNRAPREIFSAGKDWDDVFQRLKRFKGDAGRVKLERFELDEKALESYIEGFSQRQLNDTKYASKLARQFLGKLYGLQAGQAHGADAESGGQRIQVGNGTISFELRNEWRLNAILNDGESAQGGNVAKTRDDHRHHAVDAVVIGVTSPEIVRMLSAAAARKDQERRRRFAKIALPYAGFFEDVRAMVGKIIVSHRIDKKVSGALHKETFYSPPRNEKGVLDDKGEYRHQRVPLETLEVKGIKDIVDGTIREIVRKKLAELGGEPKKVFGPARPENYPQMASGVPIKKVRIHFKQNTFAVGTGARTRHVMNASNHHIEIIQTATGKWEGVVVPLSEAYQRKKAGKPIVNKDHGKGNKFLFSLALKDVVEVDVRGGKRELVTVRTIPIKGSIAFVRLTDARLKNEILKKPADWITFSIDPLRKANCKKMSVSPLGEVTPAHD